MSRTRSFLTVFILTIVGYSANIQARSLNAEDIAWLNRVTYAVNNQSLKDYEKLGRDAYLQQQLNAKTAALPPEVSKIFDDEFVSFDDRMGEILDLRDERKKAKGQDKATLVKEIVSSGKDSVYQAQARQLMRAIYSPNQLREQIVWFWLNHFNVYVQKSNIRWQIGDYEDRAIRPHALGKFKDLLKATLVHPAMLTYLDNSQSRKGNINENYARELLELHTLGVDGGYSQTDVKEVARILTGVGVNYSGTAPSKIPNGKADDFIAKHGFEFNPARHDYGEKKVLGATYKGAGWAEVEQLIDQLSKSPATAKHISTKLANYFVSDSPPQSLVKTMSEKFLATDGDIAATLEVMFKSKEFIASLKSKYRYPTQFVIASLRHEYESKTITNYGPVVSWLRQLGQPLYGYVTPNGYSLSASSWNSSGQLSQRFEIARALGGAIPQLFTEPGEKTKGKSAKPPIMKNDLFKTVYQPNLTQNTIQVLKKGSNTTLWNTLFLSSPEWQNREVSQ